MSRRLVAVFYSLLLLLACVPSLVQAQAQQCPGGSVWNGSFCVCPSNLVWYSSTQNCGCPSGTAWNTNEQKCVSTNPLVRLIDSIIAWIMNLFSGGGGPSATTTYTTSTLPSTSSTSSASVTLVECCPASNPNCGWPLCHSQTVTSETVIPVSTATYTSSQTSVSATMPWVHTDKSTYAFGEAVTITVSSVCGGPCASTLWLTIIAPSNAQTEINLSYPNTSTSSIFNPTEHGNYAVQSWSKSTFPSAQPQLLATTSFTVT
jgi:hypothetical protein